MRFARMIQLRTFFVLQETNFFNYTKNQAIKIKMSVERKVDAGI